MTKLFLTKPLSYQISLFQKIYFNIMIFLFRKIKSEGISNEVSKIQSNEVNSSKKSFIEESARKEHEWKHKIQNDLQEKDNNVITDFPSKESTNFDETRHRMDSYE